MIRVDAVSKSFGSVRAVDGVSFTIGPGELVGFLGPNGAGKSTLLRMLSTYLVPDAGAIEIAGFDTRRAPLEVRARLGYLPEHNALFDGMRVDRFLAFAGRAHGLAEVELEQRARWVVERCALDEVLGRRIRECSKGFRQRIGLAAALIHDPPVLLLDEPTHGLDPLQVAAFRAFVHELRPGRAILFSSHILAEVAAISDRILLLGGGRLLFDQPVTELASQARAAGLDLEGLVLRAVRETPGGGRLGRDGGPT
jgi:ABC-2 type transport system ATP-binding protein